MTVIKGDIPELQDASQAMTRFSQTINTNVADLQGQLRNIVWEGDDYTAYATNQSELETAVKDINETLGKAAALVGDVGQGFAEIRDWGKQAFGGR